MATFSEHIGRLRDGGRIDRDLINAAGRVAVQMLKQRGLWRLPPSYLSYHELTSWQRPDDLEVLSFEAIDFAIVRRLRPLSAKLEEYGNVDGMVWRNIGNFLTERQQTADSVGYAVYANVRAAVEAAVAQGLLRFAEPQKSTGFDVRAIVRHTGAERSSSLPSDEDLRVHLGHEAEWDNLLRGLARRSLHVQERLVMVLRALVPATLTAFRVRDLVVALRDDAREAWRQRAELNDRPTGTELGADGDLQVVPIVQPSSELENADAFDGLVRRVERAVEELPVQERRKRGMISVFREWVAAVRNRGDGPLPSQAEIGRRLDMRCSTVSDHVNQLRQVIRALNSDAVL